MISLCTKQEFKLETGERQVSKMNIYGEKCYLDKC